MYEFDLSKEQKVIDRLLEGPAAVRYRTMVDLLGRPATNSEVIRARRSARESKEVQALLGDRAKETGAGARPDWWGPGPESYAGLRLQPWVFKTLWDAGLGRADEEVRKAAQVGLDMQNPNGSFGEMKGIERVSFTAEMTYALGLIGYARSGDLRNGMRILELWLQENWPVRFDDGTPPGRMILEALALFEPFTVSELSKTVLKALFEGKRSVLVTAASATSGKIGGYNGFLTWSELGFTIGWPRGWEAPYQAMALLASCRNRDGMWGQGGSDFSETLRALKLWRDLMEAYGPAPANFRFEVVQPAASAGATAGAGRGARQAGGPRQQARQAALKPAAASTQEELTTRKRHMKAFGRAGLEELANELVGLLNEVGYQPDWRPQYEVSFRAEGRACSFKLRLESAGSPDEHVLVISAAGSSPKVNLKHWSKVLGMEGRRGKLGLQTTQGSTEQPGQVRLALGKADRRLVPKLGAFLSELVAPGGVAPRTMPGGTPGVIPGTGAARSGRNRRRRPRGGAPR